MGRPVPDNHFVPFLVSGRYRSVAPVHANFVAIIRLPSRWRPIPMPDYDLFPIFFPRRGRLVSVTDNHLISFFISARRRMTSSANSNLVSIVFLPWRGPISMADDHLVPFLWACR
jgi:hypothetical protein